MEKYYDSTKTLSKETGRNIPVKFKEIIKSGSMKEHF